MGFVDWLTLRLPKATHFGILGSNPRCKNFNLNKQHITAWNFTLSDGTPFLPSSIIDIV